MDQQNMVLIHKRSLYAGSMQWGAYPWETVKCDLYKQVVLIYKWSLEQVWLYPLCYEWWCFLELVNRCACFDPSHAITTLEVAKAMAWNYDPSQSLHVSWQPLWLSNFSLTRIRCSSKCHPKWELVTPLSSHDSRSDVRSYFELLTQYLHGCALHEWNNSYTACHLIEHYVYVATRPYACYGSATIVWNQFNPSWNVNLIILKRKGRSNFGCSRKLKKYATPKLPWATFGFPVSGTERSHESHLIFWSLVSNVIPYRPKSLSQTSWYFFMFLKLSLRKFNWVAQYLKTMSFS